MKKNLGAISLLVIFALGLPLPATAATKAGTKCSKLGSVSQSAGKQFVCIKLGKFLYWNNGTVIKPAPSMSSAPIPGSSFNPNADAITPTPVTSVTAKWGSDKLIPTPITSASAKWVEDNLVFNINWDSGNQSNVKAQSFVIEMTIKGEIYKTSKSDFPIMRQNQQTLSLTRKISTSVFGIPQTQFDKVCIFVVDDFFNDSPKYCLSEIPKYVLSISPPVISVLPATSGYRVSYVTPNSDLFDAIQIVEYVSSSSSEPSGVNFVATAWTKDNPVNVVAQSSNARWVKARFSSKFGVWTDYSNAVLVTPINAIQIR